MAKRFTDTGKWDKSWFRKLSPKMKCAWDYITHRCDHAGVWDVDFETLSHFVGEPVSLQEAQGAFDDKIEIYEGGKKLLLVGFVDFQYGSLNPSNRVHASVISRLEKLRSSKPLGSPLQRAKDKDKDKDKEKDKEGGVGETKDFAVIANPDRTDPKFSLSQENLERAFGAWLDTLAKLKMGRANLIDREQTAIARAIQRDGVNAVVMALTGPRHAPKDDFDSTWFSDVARVLSPKNFVRFVNLGVQAANQERSSA